VDCCGRCFVGDGFLLSLLPHKVDSKVALGMLAVDSLRGCLDYSRTQPRRVWRRRTLWRWFWPPHLRQKMTSFIAGKDYGCHMKRLNQATTLCLWRAEVEVGRVWQ
jgi:hypothetical protein